MLGVLSYIVTIYYIEMAVVGVCEDACSCLFFLYL